MKRSFHTVQFKGDFTDRGLPVFIICNHVSWWDGIWAFHFNREILRRKFHFMMLEEQLRKNWFFKYTGGFSVAKKSKSVLETIHYTSELLQHNENAVLMFPQGEIQSMHLHQFRFEKGIEKIIGNTVHPYQIVMLANMVDYFSNVKPNLTICYEEFLGKPTAKEIEKSYNDFFSKCIRIQQEIKS